jgi:GxxExxY protein
MNEPKIGSQSKTEYEEKSRETLIYSELTEDIIAAAIKVQRTIGPGMLESTYEACLAYELRQRNHIVETQVLLSLQYEGLEISNAFRLDLVIDNKVVVELKSVDSLSDAHFAQLKTYLRFSDYSVGLLINFLAWPLRNGGIKRVVYENK